MGRGRVLVVGGGIAGLSLAAALRRLDVGVTVFEQRPDPVAGAGLGLNLPGNAIGALRRLGLGDELAGMGEPVRRREYRNGAGRLLFSVDETAFWGAPLQPRCVRRGDLHAALRGLTDASTVRYGVRVRSVAAMSSAARVTTTGGDVETGELLVGADGVHSHVREGLAAGPPTRPALLTPASWRFVATDLGVACWSAWSGGPGTVVLIPLGAGQVYGWVSAPAAGADFARAAASFAGFPGPVRDTLAAVAAAPTPPVWSPVEGVRPCGWSAGHAVLVGDAAHATAPVWAQGAALAVEDALALAEVLGDPAGWGRAAERLAAHRHRRVAHVQAMTDRFARFARAPALLRDLAAPVIGPRSYRATYGPLRRPG